MIVFCQGINIMRTISIMFLLLGWLDYSLGVIFYRKHSLRFSHAIRHLFFLTESTFNYFLILDLIPANKRQSLHHI